MQDNVPEYCHDENIRRMQWRCRRGMLEMDLLLSRFMETCYIRLSDDERIAFDLILDYTDSDLWALIADTGNAQNLLLNHRNTGQVIMLLRHCYRPPAD